MTQPIDWSLLQPAANAFAGMITKNRESNELKDIFSKYSKNGVVDWGGVTQDFLSRGDFAGATKAATIGKMLAGDQKNHYQADAYGRIFDSQTGEYKGSGASSSAPSGAGTAPGAVNPYWAPAKNTDETKAQGFYKNGASANAVVDSLGGTVNDESYRSQVARGLSDAPAIGGIANSFVDTDAGKLDNAARRFVNAINRRESGATVSPSEMKDALSIYIPRVGDGPELLAQKAKNRQEKLQSLAGEGGPMFNPATPPPGPNPSTLPSSPYTAEQGSIDAAAAGVPFADPRRGPEPMTTPPSPPPPEQLTRLQNALKAHPEAEAEIKAAFERAFGNGQKGYADHYIYGEGR